MATNSAMLHVRMDEDTKRRGTAALAAMGLSASDAVRILFHRIIAEQAFPLELKVPNAETQAAMDEARQLLEERRMRFATPEELFATLDKGS